MEPVVEVPAEPPPVASPPPAGFVAVVWIGAFSVMVWGLLVLFRRRVQPSAAPPPRATPEPRRPEDTLD